MATLRLTEARIPSLRPAPGKTQEDFFHSPTPGAGLRVGKDGRKSFFCLFYSPATGKRTRVSLGEHLSSIGGKAEYAPECGLSLRAFEAEYAKLRGDLARGIDPFQKEASIIVQQANIPDRIPVEDIPDDLKSRFPNGVMPGTVGYLLKEFLQKHAAVAGNMTPRGYLNYRQQTSGYLKGVYEIPLGEFDAMAVRRLCDTIQQRAPQSVRQAKNVLSCAFEWAMSKPDSGIISNPCRGIKITVPKVKRDRWLNDSELQTVLSTLPLLKDQKAADVYTLILASLCRPGEASSIRAEDIINLNGERVWRVADPKNGKPFIIPLFGPIGEVINRRLLEVGKTGPLFWETPEGDDYPYHMKVANKALRAQTGLEDIRPHDFRRTARTHVSGLGVNKDVGEALLNHAKESTHGTYDLFDHWNERKQAIRVWHEKLATLQQGEEQMAA
jgi:integrase